MRRPSLVLTSIATAAALAFAPAVTADEDGGEFADITLSTSGSVVSGTLDFGGSGLRGTDGAGDAEVEALGADLGDATIEQLDGELIVRLEVLDDTAGRGFPAGLYRVDLADGLALLAYQTGTPNSFVYQLADFSDGYSVVSSPPGSYDGSVVEWRIPNTFAAGKTLSGTVGVSVGASVVTSLNGSASGTYLDTGSSKSWKVGGDLELVVLDAEGAEVGGTTLTLDAGDDFAFDASVFELEPGTYTVQATTEYGRLRGDDTLQTAELVIE